MVTVPVARVCAEPELSMDTFVGSEELQTAEARSCESPLLSTEAIPPGADQVTDCVKSWALPSPRFPVAVNWLVVLISMTESAAVTVIETKIGVTVKVVDPVTLPDVARMLALPAATPVARPAPLTVATLVSDDDQVTLPVMFLWLVSL